MLSQMIECSTAGGSAVSAASSSGGAGLSGFDWPIILAFIVGASLVALLSAGLTLVAARRLAPVPPPVPTWGQPGPV
jgi:hypothetical protein